MRKIIDINRGGGEGGYIKRGLGQMDGYGTDELYVKLLDLFANHVTPQGLDIQSIQINGPGGYTYYPVYGEPSKAEIAVQKGAAFLDLFLVGQDWRKAIVTDNLDLTSGWNCILGQTAVMAHLDGGGDGYGKFAEHIIALGIAPEDEGISGKWFCDHGFYSNGIEHTYAELQVEWERELLNG